MRVLFIIFICLTGFYPSNAQDAKFTIEVSTDSVLMGNYFQVSFKIENGAASNFTAPDFQGFSIVGGPNQSSTYSMVNGVSSQSMSYSYYLQPTEEGQFFIEPASIEIDGEIFETNPIEIKVAPNPDGIIQQPNKKEYHIFDSFSPFDSFFDQQPTFPKQEPKKKKTKKKRKTVKI